MKIKRFLLWLKTNACAVIVAVLAALSLVAAPLWYAMSYRRLWSSLWDFGRSFIGYFCILFGFEIPFQTTVTQFPDIDLSAYLPFGVAEIERKLESLLPGIFNWRHFVGYLNWVLQWIYFIVLYLSILIPVIFILKRVILARIIFKENHDYGEQTKALVWWRNEVETRIGAVCGFFRSVWECLRGKALLFWGLVVLWIVNLNVATIAVELLAFYFEFAANVSFSILPSILGKTFIDAVIMFSGAPFLFWLAVSLWLLNLLRKWIGYRRLEHMERMNRGFINSLPIASLMVGTMGASKTTHITDFAISQEILFRDKALELMQKNELKFPYFPWINVELEIKSLVEHGYIYNLATIEEWGQALHCQFEEYPTRQVCFGYDFAFGFTYQDDLREYDLFEVITTYAKLYFIYMIECALVVSNYCIRLDFERDDLGNFPLWNHNLFKWDVGDLPQCFQTSHIVDFDMMRLGKKVVENNVFSGALEFGVIVCSEFGKERKNNLETQEIKKNSFEANQKNDLMDYWLKMCRHGAVVDNFPFIKFFSDEQRPESLGANSRDLFQIVRFKESLDSDIALPFFALEGFLYTWLYPKYSDFHTEYRFYRADHTLVEYLIKRVCAPFFAHCERLQNRFGFTPSVLTVEDGTLDGERKEHKYFKMPKKIYSERFRTNSFAPIFYRRALQCGKGLIDRQTYAGLDATEEELLAQNSYANNEMYGGKVQ